jgi:hypothetical protein
MLYFLQVKDHCIAMVFYFEQLRLSCVVHGNPDIIMRKFHFITVLLCSVMIFACSESKDNVMLPPADTSCDPATSTFSADVAPIVRTKCAISAGCHGTGSVNGPAALTSYTAIKNAAANIRRAVYTGIMPKTGFLSPEQKKAIICWVDLGAPNN